MRLNNVQFFSNMANVLSLLFIPVFAESLGASYFEVGFIVGIYSATTLLSSFVFGRLADLYRLRTVLLGGFGFSAAAFLLQVFAADPFSLMFARALAGFSVGIHPGALIAYIYYQKQSLGKFISLGSLGWMAGFLAAGLIGIRMDVLFGFSSLCYAFCFLQASGLKDIKKQELSTSYFSFKTLLNNSGTYFSLFLRHTGAVGIWTIFPLYLQELGANAFWIGVIYAINPAAQFIIMRMLDPFENEKLIRTGYLLSEVGFISFIFAPSYLYVIPGMFVIACSWSFLYVGSTRRVVELNPDKATAAGLINSMIGAAGVAGALFGGVLSQFFGLRATIVGAALFSFSGFLLYKTLGKAAGKTNA